MNFDEKFKALWVALIAVAIIAITGLFTPAGSSVMQTVGAVTGVTNYDNLGVLSLKVGSGCNNGNTYSGCTGTKVSKMLRGTCNVTQNVPGSFVASSTALFFCTVTGVASGDNVFVSLPVGAGTPASQGQGFHVVSAFATTSNQIGMILSNDIGAATSSFAQATTSVAYWIVD